MLRSCTRFLGPFHRYPRTFRSLRVSQRTLSSAYSYQYSSNSNSTKSESQEGTTGSNTSDNVSSSAWTSSKVFFVSALAAGLGYALANSSQSPALKSSSKPRYGSEEDFKKAIVEIRAKLGADAVTIDEDELKLHGFSEWSSINVDRLPVAVSYPKNTQEVSEIVKICQKYKMPMIPYSGGSSLEANFAAPHGGMTIDFASMNAVLELHEDDMDVVVQPSIRWMDLNEKIKDTGLFFPVDPGPSAMIGGMIGTNCSGTNAVRYGTMKDWVINLTVVLPDGRIIKTRKRPRKTSAGYNLTGMFIGAEGTLGIVTEATLKLAAIPEEMRVGVMPFPTMRDAASAAMQVIRKGIPVQCMEILDDVQMDVINRAGGTGRTWEKTPTLFFKFSGSAGIVADSISLTKAIAEKNNGKSLEFAKDEREAHDLWSARKASLWSMMALREEGSEIWSTDVAVPVSRLPDIIEKSKEDIDSLGLFASVLGHIGDGNFHTSVMYDPRDPAERQRVEKVVYDMVDRGLEMEGSCTGEHGVGVGKKESLKKELGLETIEVMRTIKRSLDPNWLMNPGKIFDFE